MKKALLALIVSAAPLSATTFTGTVSGDTYIRNDGTPNTNYNSDAANRLLVGSNGATDNLRALLKFNVTSIVNDVISIGGGNFSNLTINSASLQLYERAERATSTVNVVVHQYGFAFNPATSTWNAPATGDTTAGGTIGTTLGSQSILWNTTGADNDTSTITLTPSLVQTAVAGHLNSTVNFLLNTTSAASNFISVTSDLSATTTRHAKLTIDYTVTPAGGPILTLDATTPNPDYTFPISQTTASPLTRTLRYKNTGDLPVTISTITVTNTTGTTFSLGSVSPSLPATIAVGQTIDIPVLANNANAGSFTGSIFIDADVNSQDKTLPLAASFYKSGNLYNSNTSLITDLTNWGGGSTWVTPGLLGFLADGMARVRGVGDPLQPVVKSSLYQDTAVPNNIPNWELDFRFSPIAASQFASYTNGTPLSGSATDRTFQLVVQADDATLPNPNLTSTFDDKTIINLAYLPDGNVDGGVAGFYLYSGTSHTWQLVDFNGDGSPLVLDGSTDVDTDANPSNGVGDGILNVATGDTVNVYRMSIRGSNFGTGAATYTLTLTGPNGLSKTKTGLTISHNQSITTALPASFAFITSDQSAESNATGALCPSFWVDEVGYFAVDRPSQRLLVFDPIPTPLRSLNGSTPNHTIIFFNDGTSANVQLSAAYSGTSAITLQSPPSFPAAITPGNALNLTLLYDPTLLVSPTTAAVGSLAITSDDTTLLSATYPITATKVTTSNLIANSDFESTSPSGSFPIGWTLTGTPSSITSFLSSGGGTTAVSLAPNQGIYQDIAPTTADGLDDFQCDFAFQIGNETQAHRIRMEGNNGGDLLTMRLTTNPSATDSIDVFNAGTWITALSGLTISPNTTYHIRVIGRKFSQANRKYTIGFSTDGVNFTTSAYLTAFHATSAAKFETATFDCGASVGSSLLIDNVIATMAPPDDFAYWIGGYNFAAFPGADLSANGDADHDGIPNLVEQVLGTAPNATTTGLTQISATNHSVTFNHPLNATLASDVTYTYQWSTDLSEWKTSGQSNSNSITATISPSTPVAGVVTVTTTATVGSPTKLFTRLVAHQTP